MYAIGVHPELRSVTRPKVPPPRKWPTKYAIVNDRTWVKHPQISSAYGYAKALGARCNIDRPIYRIDALSFCDEILDFAPV